METTLDAKKIDADALALLESIFGDVDSIKLPIDLNLIARRFNLTIKQGEFADADIEGALDRKTRTVFLSEKDTFAEKNFTLAHEIGHYKLHEDLAQDIFTMHQLNNLLDRQGDDEREDEADLFAASLLMPKKLVESLWKTAKDVDTLAKIFGVPIAVATFRLRTLKLI